MVKRGGENTRVDPKAYKGELKEYPDSIKEVLEKGKTRRRLSTVLGELKLKNSVKADVGLLPEMFENPVNKSISAVKAKPGPRSYGINFITDAPKQRIVGPALYTKKVGARRKRKTLRRKRKHHK